MNEVDPNGEFGLPGAIVGAISGAVTGAGEGFLGYLVKTATTGECDHLDALGDIAAGAIAGALAGGAVGAVAPPGTELLEGGNAGASFGTTAISVITGVSQGEIENMRNGYGLGGSPNRGTPQSNCGCGGHGI